jgi:dGTPase
MKIAELISDQRLRKSSFSRADLRDDFYSDRSRVVFSSSFRRMMKKAQVFSLETNTYVRNRLTHTLEVADIGRTLARAVGVKLTGKDILNAARSEGLVAIVENACLLHDIGNPPFGHFGEEAIKSWFTNDKIGRFLPPHLCQHGETQLDELLADFLAFDGNPQGFRIATRLHNEVGDSGLNLTCSTLLAMVKYPYFEKQPSGTRFAKKIGVFRSEKDLYLKACELLDHPPGSRFFLAYLMELADDICYCLSDIGDSFEKQVTTSRDYVAEITEICKADGISVDQLVPDKGRIDSFAHDVAITVARRVVDEASRKFVDNLPSYISGEANELVDDVPGGKLLKCLKTFARRFIYTSPEAQRIEIAGSQIVTGLLNHFGMLLRIPRADFQHFIKTNEMRKDSHLDIEWRVFSQLSKRMRKVYDTRVTDHTSDLDEWVERARLIVDYISGLTDDSARDVYQNYMGISI